MVMIQAAITLRATPQRTAEARRAVPKPMMDPVIVGVVETGMPSQRPQAWSMTIPSISLATSSNESVMRSRCL